MILFQPQSKFASIIQQFAAFVFYELRVVAPNGRCFL